MPGTEPRILAVLTVRDEGAFLIDWLAWHRQAGVTDVLALSNDCSDGTDLMLDRLQSLGWLTHVRNPGPHPRGAQWSALALADRHPLRAAADWTLVLDIDEFVMVHAGDGTLGALIAALPDATAITLTWRLFGNAGILSRDNRPPPEVFQRCAPAVMGWPWRAAMFKTMFRDDGSYRKLGVHRPRQPDRARLPAQRWFDGAGRQLPPAFAAARLYSPFGRDNYALAQLCHYALGSVEDYVLKCARGRANRGTPAQGLDYWVERNICADSDARPCARLAASAPLAAALRADPRLAQLDAAARAWRDARFRALMADEGWRSLYGRLLMAPASRLPDPAASARILQFAADQRSAGAGQTVSGDETA